MPKIINKRKYNKIKRKRNMIIEIKRIIFINKMKMNKIEKNIIIIENEITIKG